MRMCLFPVCCALLSLSPQASGEFVAGRVYVLGFPHQPMVPPYARIHEFDPASGGWTQFAEFPAENAGIVSSLAFRPDGTGLLASNADHDQIVEIDGSGAARTAYESADGIEFPMGFNGLAFNAAGDLFVAQSPHILRIPADGSTPQSFADLPNPAINLASLAFSPAGTLYVVPAGQDFVYTLDADGAHTLFDTLPLGSQASSVATDPSGNLYVLATNGLYRYEGGDAARRERVGNFQGRYVAAMIFSPMHDTLFATYGRTLYSIDPQTGESQLLGDAPAEDGYNGGVGLAVFVPEPTSLVLISALFGLATLHRRRG